MNAARANGECALLLHTHMPYVEGFGTWPFGEEWLFEAMATCYLPLLSLLDDDAPVTLSMTPVLADQLEVAGLAERFRRFITDVRRETHRLDVEGLRRTGYHELAEEVRRAGEDYETALTRCEEIDGDLLARLSRHTRWTSSATHAVLPLCATDAGARMQIESGIAAHRARAGAWDGGFWLPECAYAPWLDELLVAAGVQRTCVDLTDLWGLGSPEHLVPRRTEDGLLVAPIDRESIELVWGSGGYPSHGTYRDYHRHTIHHHRPWANDGRSYDHGRAVALAREHARDFVVRCVARLRDGGLLVCALDTELLGHWWYEGLAWLAAVIDEAPRAGLRLVTLDDAAALGQPQRLLAPLPQCSWGTPRDLSTWDGPQVADIVFAQRAAELALLDSPAALNDVAARELLALQASDWAFLSTRELAGEYPAQRIEGHAARLAAASGSSVGSPANEMIRNLAVHARRSALLRP